MAWYDSATMHRPLFFLDEPHYHHLFGAGPLRFRGAALAIDGRTIERVRIVQNGRVVGESEANRACPERARCWKCGSTHCMASWCGCRRRGRANSPRIRASPPSSRTRFFRLQSQPARNPRRRSCPDPAASDTGTGDPLCRDNWGLDRTDADVDDGYFTWDAVAGAASYDLSLKSSSGAYAFRKNVQGTSTTDSAPPSSNGVVLYQVVARNSTSVSPASAPDVAYVGSFTDLAITAQQTVVKRSTSPTCARR